MNVKTNPPVKLQIAELTLGPKDMIWCPGVNSNNTDGDSVGHFLTLDEADLFPGGPGIGGTNIQCPKHRWNLIREGRD